MIKKAFFLIVFLVVLTACSSTSKESTPPQAATLEIQPTQAVQTTPITMTQDVENQETANTPASPVQPEGGQASSFAGEQLPVDHNNFFSGSGQCASCHTNLQDQSGEDVSIDTAWRSTMMANAARDPYWLATVKSEEIENPTITDAIEDKCSTCHMPLARTTVSFNGQKGAIFGAGFLNPNNEYHSLATDSVSCTLCHQIQPDNLGDPESFSGGFSIKQDQPDGARSIFGPFPTQQKLATIMQSGSGFVPVQNPHIEDSALCGSCHTLYTPTINEDGEVVGEFPEQTAYLEWLHSDYKDQQSCQDCHMPEANGKTKISNITKMVVSPFRKHLFVGGNVEILNLFRNYGVEMNLTSSSDQLDTTINRTLDLLQTQTATITVTNIQRVANFVNVDLLVQNITGHKFPTGYPSRRAWIHITIQDENGNLLYESGKSNPDGSIIENDNDLEPIKYEPHYEIIEKPNQVQIYESIIHDVEGNITTKLLRGAGYIKDNRIIPKGFTKEDVDLDISVFGNAMKDPDFIGGEDQVFFRIDLGDYNGQIIVNVELLYQSLSFRWTQNLEQFNGDEINLFFEKYDTIPKEPVLISSDSKTWTPNQ